MAIKGNAKPKRGRTEFEKRLRWRKLRLYMVPVIAFILCNIVSFELFNRQFEEVIMPQIQHAIIEMAELLPNLEKDEQAVREIYDTMVESRKRIIDSGMPLSTEYDTDQTGVDLVINENLSWMDRVTNLKVGHNGAVIVVSKADGTILAHPDDAFEGQALMINSLMTDDDTFAMEIMEEVEDHGAMIPIADVTDIGEVSLENLGDEIYSDDFTLERLAVVPESAMGLGDMLDAMLDASIVSYGDTYIVCGIGMPELLSFLDRGFYISVILALVLIVFVKYICLQMERHDLDLRSLRNKLVAYGVMICIGVFAVAWYIQILSSVTLELKTMENHAKAAVNTLETYKESQENINAWLDEQYLSQCRVAADYVSYMGSENLTRDDMARLAEDLGVQFVSVFDERGSVVVTNSPYDHMTISRSPSDPSYEFLPLLDGEDYLIQGQTKTRYGEAMQYIGVCLRDKDDLCDGFVQIGVDPTLRNRLMMPLDVETVLSNLVVGLPENAIAIDKDTLTVSASNGIGFISEPIENVGLSADMLRDAYSGYVSIGKEIYYAGFSESADLFLVPMTPRKGNVAALNASLEVTVVMLIVLAAVIWLTMRNYQRDVLDLAPKAKPRDADGEPHLSRRTRLKGLKDILNIREKSDFDNRWKRSIPKSEQTPAMRIRAIVYHLMTVFCIVNIAPLIYFGFYRGYNTEVLNSLAFVITGNWEKGLNIFAFTSCLLLLFILFILYVAISSLLYWIARVTDMQAETVCLLLRSSLRYVSVIIFVYYGLSQFGIPSQTLLASAGIMTLVISMGAKDFVNDIVAGFFILFEGNIKVGDAVTIGSWSGTVQEIGIRTSKVHSFGMTKVFNNSSMRDIVNATGPVFRVAVPLQIAYDEDIRRVEAIFEKELPGLYKEIPGLLGAPTLSSVTDMDSDSVTVTIAAMAKKDARFSAQNALRKHVKLIVDQYNIDVPFNHVVVHKGSDMPVAPEVLEETKEEE